jgi:hypothetical protein
MSEHTTRIVKLANGWLVEDSYWGTFYAPNLHTAIKIAIKKLEAWKKDHEKEQRSKKP